MYLAKIDRSKQIAASSCVRETEDIISLLHVLLRLLRKVAHKKNSAVFYRGVDPCLRSFLGRISQESREELFSHCVNGRIPQSAWRRIHISEEGDVETGRNFQAPGPGTSSRVPNSEIVDERSTTKPQTLETNKSN
ncbi:uncharacterized protein LOC121970401 isoform X2 [Zingiber officinale]|uniref:uncharacterized protein LOC121970401 isoform X2 n=1 Tax=Zingiber officinale TaxID=94328 RepID=UPI001C4AE26B|nr:uncharacterized protein LOC121970401 isoform X2 [Zingiber officinale]